MSISYVRGNLLEAADVNILVRGCNCFCTMGSGVALQIAKKYPQAKTADSFSIPGSVDEKYSYVAAIPKGYSYKYDD